MQALSRPSCGACDQDGCSSRVRRAGHGVDAGADIDRHPPQLHRTTDVSIPTDVVVDAVVRQLLHGRRMVLAFVTSPVVASLSPFWRPSSARRQRSSSRPFPRPPGDVRAAGRSDDRSGRCLAVAVYAVFLPWRLTGRQGFRRGALCIGHAVRLHHGGGRPARAWTRDSTRAAANLGASPFKAFRIDHPALDSPIDVDRRAVRVHGVVRRDRSSSIFLVTPARDPPRRDVFEASPARSIPTVAAVATVIFGQHDACCYHRRPHHARRQTSNG